MSAETRTSGCPDRVAVAFALPLVRNRRVLWVGDIEDAAMDRLGRVADGVRILALGKTGKPPKGVRIATYRGAELPYDDGAFDVAIAPSWASLDDADALVDELARVTDGALVLGVPGADDGLYADAYDALRDVIAKPRVFGYDPGVSGAVSDLSAPVDSDAELVVDDLASVDATPSWLLLVAGEDAERLPEHLLVQVDANAAAVATAEEAVIDDAELRALEDEVSEALAERDAARADAKAALKDAKAATKNAADAEKSLEKAEKAAKKAEKARRALEQDLEDAAERLRGLEASLADAEKAAESARKQPKKKAVAPEDVKALERDVKRLEAHLEERSHAVRELEAEVTRRGHLVRDLVEESERLRNEGGDGGAAAARALEAEAARAELQFRVDELETKLSAVAKQGVTPSPASVPEAPAEDPERPALEGRIRGLRARVAELEELRANAEAQLALARSDIDAAAARALKLEREKAEAIEQFELQLVRAQRPAEVGGQERIAALEESERRLSERVGELSGLLDAARGLADEQTAAAQAAEAAKQAAEADATAARAEVDELEGERNGLAMRLADLEASRPAPAAGSAAPDDRLIELQSGLAEAKTKAAALEVQLGEALRNKSQEDAKVRRLEYAVTTRDALVERLRTDLATAERAADEASRGSQRAEDEVARLRQAVLDASGDVDKLEAKAAEAEGAKRDAERALEEIRNELEALRDDAAEAEEPSGEGAAVDVEALEGELAARDTMVASLTRQLEERNDRIRALEVRLDEGGDADDVEALRREVLTLRERADRLDDELGAERSARREAATELEAARARPEADAEIRRLESDIADKLEELVGERGRAAGFERDLRSVQDVCAEARSGLEGLLGEASSRGDEETADRLASLITLLGRY